jgi:vacuolar protein 8
VSFDFRQCAICRSPDVPFMQSAAAACICNLAANVNSKETIATSGALEVLVTVLQSENQAAAAQVSVFYLSPPKFDLPGFSKSWMFLDLILLFQKLLNTACALPHQAAGALWSLCVDNDKNKQRVADVGAIPHLISLLHAQDTFAQSQSAGALSECSIRNDSNKKLISDHGAIVPLVKMLRSPDLSVQRLSSCALCNVCANHDDNKAQAREVGALPVLVNLLSVSQVPEVLSPVAGAICNLSMKVNLLLPPASPHPTPHPHPTPTPPQFSNLKKMTIHSDAEQCPENKAEFNRLGAANVLGKLVTSPIPSLHGNAIAALEQLESQ